MKLKILIFSKESRGGVGTYLKQLQFLNDKETNLTFLLYKKDLLCTLNPGYVLIGHDYPSSEAFSFYKVIIFFRALVRTRTVLKKTDHNIILTCDRYASIQVLTLKSLGLLPKNVGRIIITINNNYDAIDANKPFIYRFFFKYITERLYHVADHIVVTSHEIKKILTDTGCKNSSIGIIPNGVDFDLINKKRNKDTYLLKKMKEDNSIKILSVGRFEKQKDFVTIIKSFSYAQTRCKKLKLSLYLIGEGSEKKNLEEYCKRIGIEKQVTFFGWQKDIYPFLKGADMFLFASHHEGFGLTIIEAMASGLPVVTTNTPYGPSEIVGNGKYGMLVPMKDTFQMAKKIIELSTNKRLRSVYKTKSLQRSKDYDVQTIIKKYKRLFNTIYKNERRLKKSTLYVTPLLGLNKE